VCVGVAVEAVEEVEVVLPLFLGIVVIVEG